MTALRELSLGAAGRVPLAALEVRFARSGGPGGQHVNKTETKVDLRCDLNALSDALGPDTVERLRDKLVRRLDAEGRVFVVCDEFRSRHRNLERALERMEELLRQALVRPKPRRPGRPTRGSQERRLAEKKRRADVKKGRRAEPGD